jgi:hypothetical protein
LDEDDEKKELTGRVKWVKRYSLQECNIEKNEITRMKIKRLALIFDVNTAWKLTVFPTFWKYMLPPSSGLRSS